MLEHSGGERGVPCAGEIVTIEGPIAADRVSRLPGQARLLRANGWQETHRKSGDPGPGDRRSEAHEVGSPTSPRPPAGTLGNLIQYIVYPVNHPGRRVKSGGNSAVA
jgi:hypothetical protein